MHDLVFAARALRKNAGFSVVAVVTLALGVGANTSIFSVVKAVLPNQLPYRQPERLVTVAASDPDTPRPACHAGRSNRGAARRMKSRWKTLRDSSRLHVFVVDWGQALPRRREDAKSRQGLVAALLLCVHRWLP